MENSRKSYLDLKREYRYRARVAKLKYPGVYKAICKINMPDPVFKAYYQIEKAIDQDTRNAEIYKMVKYDGNGMINSLKPIFLLRRSL